LRVSIEVIWDLLVLREVIVRERLRAIICLILILISLVIVVKVVKISVVSHVHVVVIVIIVPIYVVVLSVLFEVEADLVRARLLLLFGVIEVVVVAYIDIIRVVVDLDFVLTILNLTRIFPWKEIVLAEIKCLFVIVRWRNKLDNRFFSVLIEVRVDSEVFISSDVDWRN